MEDNVKDRHEEWEGHLYQWVATRDALSGESAIKMQSEMYLPMPAAMKLTTSRSPSSGAKTYSHFHKSHDVHDLLLNSYNPNYHPNEPYCAYKTRAHFPEITSAIMRGLVGIAMDTPPSWELPSKMEYLEESFSKSGTPLLDFFEYALKQTLSVGRLGLLVDFDDTDKMLKVSSYAAESMIDWKPLTNSYDEVRIASVSLLEYDEEDNEVIFKPMLLDNKYVVEKYVKGTLEEVIEPKFMGKRLDEVPFTVAGSTDINVAVDISPMFAVSRLALQIYQLDADLRQGEYMSCNPSLVISGISEEFAPRAIGSTQAIILPDSAAKAYYPSTDTSALNHVAQRIEALYGKAAEHGVSLIGSNKVESGDALRIRQHANNATLASCVISTCKAIERTLKNIAIFMGENPDSVVFEANTNFGAQRLTPQEQDSMVKSWMAGAISKSTMLYNFQMGGLLQEGETFEDEADRIDDEEPADPLQSTGGVANIDTLAAPGAKDTSQDTEEVVEDEDADK